MNEVTALLVGVGMVVVVVVISGWADSGALVVVWVAVGGNDVVGGVILGCFFDLYTRMPFWSSSLTSAALVDASFDLDGFLQVFL